MTVIEREILELCNAVLETQYADIDDVSDAELRRVYMVSKIAMLLEENPDIKIFTCRPEALDAPPLGPASSEAVRWAGEDFRG